MTSSRNWTDGVREPGPDQPLAGGGGVSPPSRVANPFDALDSLMAVVEELCPQWPARPPFGPASNLRI